jgi:argonaute-like protein implicated in RNA metabolism and viral defense
MTGCANSEKAYIATANTLVVARKGLIAAREAQKIDDDQWKQIKEWSAEAQYAMEQWSVELDKNNNAIKPSNLARLVAQISRAYVRIYGTEPGK